MASTNQEPPGIRRRQVLYESRREREFYRYYEPIRALSSSGPPLCDLHDAGATNAHLPSSSPDRALTAFCQLGALRLGARRAMMFFFDSNYAYILAEATRTLSLLDDSIHDIDDALWLGHSIIPRGFSVCEHTANLPENLGSNRDDPNASIVHIINDMAEDTRFCDRAYVKGGPLARFYAGVPITTSKGINIGAYCIVDDKPRDGLSDKSVTFLKDMAATIMTHLEMVRATSDHKRDSSMLSGLSAFVDGASSLRQRKEQSATLDRTPRASVHPLSEAGKHPKTPSPSSTSPLEIKIGSDAQQDVAPNDATPRSPVDVAKPSASLSPGDVEALSSQSQKFADSNTVNISARTELQEQLVASNIKATFDRVAPIVREAVDVDGALFLDARVASYAGLVGRRTDQSKSEPTSDSGLSTSDMVNTENDEPANAEQRNVDLKGEPCYILGSSIHSAFANGADYEPNDMLVNGNSNISDKFLQTLLRKYPRGKIWNFNEEGDASSEDESSGSSTSQRGDGNSQASTTDDSGRETLRRSRTRKAARIDDGREIQRLFPGVRSVALVGMWDQIKGRWYAGCFVWTYSPLRLLSERCEVNFMTAFCDAIMAEVHRLEAQNSDNNKMDFISSISHELRSPLHGILGSVECLQEQTWDAASDGLISQVEVCARTLLDIVNHVLDFSKIYRYARVQNRSMGGHKSRQKPLGIADDASRVGGNMTLDADVSLDLSTEEVVETTYYSFCCSKDQQTILDRKVAFILDIDRSPETNWTCRIAIGGWKRICINLISNALKYTTQGYVHVSLKSVPIRHRREFNAVLTVSDTGRGMSQDFLLNHLFKAFSQEDTLVEGTGLGMSLVAKMVKALGGKIDVKSMKDIGTTITVTVPLGHGTEKSQPGGTNRAEQLNGISIGILESTRDNLGRDASNLVSDGDGKALVVSSLKRTCSELGMHVQDVTKVETAMPDLAIVLESDLALLQAPLDEPEDEKAALVTSKINDVPWIVLCNNAVSERHVRSKLAAFPPRINDVLISLPAGPNRLAEAIRTCLKYDPESKSLRTNKSEIEAISGKVLSEPVISRAQPANLAQSSSNTHRRWRSDSLTSLPNESLDPRLLHAEPVHRPRDVSGDLPSERMLEHDVGDRHTMEALGTLKLEEASQFIAKEDVRKELCLLLVDDNQINLQLLVTYAEKRKHQKITATDGLQAVEAYKTAYMRPDLPRSGESNSKDIPPGKPQVVLMDINMPVLDGFEATRRIRKFEKQKRLEPATIIALTGLGSVDAQQEAYGSGVDLFLTKPVRLKELTRILETVKYS